MGIVRPAVSVCTSGGISGQRISEIRPMPGKPSADRRLNVYIDGYNFYVPLSSSGNESDYELAWCNFLHLAEHLLEKLSHEHREFAGYRLGAIKYFTATIPEGMPSNASGIQRKYNWLDALNHESHGRVEVIHGTFRPRKHRFYIESEELDKLARAGIPVNWEQIPDKHRTYHPQLTVHEEKQTDVMLASALVTDAALGRQGRPAQELVQPAPLHRSNTRPTPAPCHAAVVISADIDFLPAAEMAAHVFDCPVVIAFTYPHIGYRLNDLAVYRRDLLVQEVSASELRGCQLPDLVKLGSGKSISLAEVRKTHFRRIAPTSG